MNLYRSHPPTSSLFPKLYSLTTILRVISISALTSNLEAGFGVYLERVHSFYDSPMPLFGRGLSSYRFGGGGGESWKLSCKRCNYIEIDLK